MGPSRCDGDFGGRSLASRHYGSSRSALFLRLEQVIACRRHGEILTRPNPMSVLALRLLPALGDVFLSSCSLSAMWAAVQRSLVAPRAQRGPGQSCTTESCCSGLPRGAFGAGGGAVPIAPLHGDESSGRLASGSSGAPGAGAGSRLPGASLGPCLTQETCLYPCPDPELDTVTPQPLQVASDLLRTVLRPCGDGGVERWTGHS